MKQQWIKNFTFLMLIASAGLMTVSCAHRSVSSTTVQSTQPGTVVTTTGTVPVTTSSTTVERETVVEREDANIISRTFDIIGQIIALPFRLVAGIFETIF